MIMIFGFSTAMAKEIQIIQAGSNGGSAMNRAKLYEQGFKTLGYTVDYKAITNIGQSVKLFNETDKPTIMIYASPNTGKVNLGHNNSNFVGLEYVSAYYVCISNQAMNKKEIKLGVGKGISGKPAMDALSVLNKKSTVQVYKNSGAILKAAIAGDIDAFFTNQSKSLKFVKAGKGKCIGNTTNETAFDVPPLKDMLKNADSLPIVYYSLLAKNVNIKQIRKDFVEIVDLDIFKSYHNKRNLVRVRSTWAEELKIAQDSERAWKKR